MVSYNVLECKILVSFADLALLNKTLQAKAHSKLSVQQFPYGGPGGRRFRLGTDRNVRYGHYADIFVFTRLGLKRSGQAIHLYFLRSLRLTAPMQQGPLEWRQVPIQRSIRKR